MQFEDLEHETSALILRLKNELAQFKQSLNILIQNVEIKFQEIISKLINSKNYMKSLQKEGILLDDSLFFGLVQEMNNYKDQQYHHLILNKLRKRIKYWNYQCKKTIQIQTENIFQINEVCSFDNILKQNKIIMGNNKQAQLDSTQTQFCFALLDKPVDCKRIQQFLFQINNFTKNVGIGIVNLQVIKNVEFKINVELENHGSYLCLADKSIRHNTDNVKNRKQIGITMNVGDLIQLIFDPFQKSIVWKNLNNKEQFQTQINSIDEELRVCVAMKFKNTVVQISDDESMIE